MKHVEYLKATLEANVVRGNTRAPLVTGEFVPLGVAQAIALQTVHIAVGEATQMTGQAKRLDLAATILSGVVTQMKGDDQVAGIVKTALVMTDLLFAMAQAQPNTLPTTEPPSKPEPGGH